MVESGKLTHQQIEEYKLGKSPGRNAESRVDFELRRLEAEQKAEDNKMKENRDLYLKRRLEKKYDELQGLSLDQTKKYMKAYDKFMVTRGMQNKQDAKVKRVDVSQQEILSQIKSVTRLSAHERSKKNLNIDMSMLYGMES